MRGLTKPEKGERRVVRTVRVVAGKDEPVAEELLAREISAVAAGMERINKSSLKTETMVLLISHASGVGKPSVRAVLDTMSRLKETYLKKGA